VEPVLVLVLVVVVVEAVVEVVVAVVSGAGSNISNCSSSLVELVKALFKLEEVCMQASWTKHDGKNIWVFYPKNCCQLPKYARVVQNKKNEHGKRIKTIRSVDPPTFAFFHRSVGAE